MLFCPKCRYAYNVTKDAKSKQVGGKTNSSLNKIFEKFNTGGEISKNDLDKIKSSDLLSDDRYESLNIKNQKKLNKMISNANKEFFSDVPVVETVDQHAFFICKNCKNSEPIKPMTTIYTKSYGTTATIDMDDYTYMIHDNSLPRTRAYICRYNKCSTHKNPLTREAIITKNPLEQVIYVCTVCGTDWVNTA